MFVDGDVVHLAPMGRKIAKHEMDGAQTIPLVVSETDWTVLFTITLQFLYEVWGSNMIEDSSRGRLARGVICACGRSPIQCKYLSRKR